MTRILFVDDEINVLEGIKRLLRAKRPEWELITESSALAALKHIREVGMDVVVSDMRMPGFDGIALLRALKGEPSTEHIPVIMLTGYVDADAKVEALRLGTYDFVNKPADPHELVARLTSAIRLKDYEDQLRQQNDLLERQLIQSQKMEIVGLLASGIVHDLNNILGGVIGHTELAVQKVGTGGRAQENLQKALESAEHATKLVRQILTLGRASNSPTESNDLSLVIEEGLQLLSVTVPSGTTVAWSRPESPAIVEMDATQIHQVLLNLCTNAVHAMDGCGSLTVSLSPVELDEAATEHHGNISPGPFYCLRVTDTGSGIEPAALSKIFDAFYTSKKAGKGTGVGLSVVQRIIHNHHGFITVESTVGEGTTFSVFLPRAAIQEPQPVQDAGSGVLDSETLAVAQPAGRRTAGMPRVAQSGSIEDTSAPDPSSTIHARQVSAPGG